MNRRFSSPICKSLSPLRVILCFEWSRELQKLSRTKSIKVYLELCPVQTSDLWWWENFKKIYTAAAWRAILKLYFFLKPYLFSFELKVADWIFWRFILFTPNMWKASNWKRNIIYIFLVSRWNSVLVELLVAVANMSLCNAIVWWKAGLQLRKKPKKYVIGKNKTSFANSITKQ